MNRKPSGQGQKAAKPSGQGQKAAQSSKTEAAGPENEESERSSKPKNDENVIWRGWLHKLCRGLIPHWQQRWFELQREKYTKRPDRAVLKYFTRIGGSLAIVEKRLTVVDANRVLGRTHYRQGCLSVVVQERRENVILSASSTDEADTLVSDILSILNTPQPPERGRATAVTRRSPSPSRQRSVSPGFAVKRN